MLLCSPGMGRYPQGKGLLHHLQQTLLAWVCFALQHGVKAIQHFQKVLGQACSAGFF